MALPFLAWGFNAMARASQEASSVPQEWQLTLDVVKSKEQRLMIENNALQVEYGKLTGQVQQLQQLIDDQQYKNGQLKNFLRERHGRTNQQVRIEELTRIIKTKKQEARALEKQTAQSQVDDQLARLRQQLEYESTQELLLGKELGALKRNRSAE